MKRKREIWTNLIVLADVEELEMHLEIVLQVFLRTEGSTTADIVLADVEELEMHLEIVLQVFLRTEGSTTADLQVLQERHQHLPSQ